MGSQVENTLGFSLILRAFCEISVEKYCDKTVDNNVENSRTLINAKVNFLLCFHRCYLGSRIELPNIEIKKSYDLFFIEK